MLCMGICSGWFAEFLFPLGICVFTTVEAHIPFSIFSFSSSSAFFPVIWVVGKWEVVHREGMVGVDDVANR